MHTEHFPITWDHINHHKKFQIPTPCFGGCPNPLKFYYISYIMKIGHILEFPIILSKYNKIYFFLLEMSCPGLDLSFDTHIAMVSVFCGGTTSAQNDRFGCLGGYKGLTHLTKTMAIWVSNERSGPGQFISRRKKLILLHFEQNGRKSKFCQIFII